MNVKDFNLFKGLILLFVLPLIALIVIVHFLDVGPDPLRKLGAATAVVIIYKILRLSFTYYKNSKKKREPKSYGNWAIVTGCTGGLGQAFAHGLAAKGMNILLISRNPEKLNNELQAIESKYQGIKCKILAYDFTNSEGASDFYKNLTNMVKEELKSDIGVLVNNVGVGNESPIYSTELDPSLESDMIRINCEGTCRMTRAILPIMIEKKCGAIINVSSGSGTHPSPFLAVYGATKAFINQYSQSVAYEVKEFGVDVLGIHPYYICGTGLYAAKKPSLNAPAASQIVDDTLASLGSKVLAYPYFFHAFMGWGFLNLLPDCGDKMLSMMKMAKSRNESAKSK
jgi:17beta-estradiol 17-dehydrogenase / very-long-chain 3-oxoacyl-CoA reductase